MKKILSIILSVAMLLSMATVAFADDTFVLSGAREAEGIIKVGVNAEFPPFEYMENDKLLGFDIDLMNYIAARIGYGVEFVDMSFDKLIPAVVNGEVDCAISAITATDERESVVDFTRPYLAANVTYKDGDSVAEALEMYSIVFKDGVADAHYKSSMPTAYEKLFMLVDGTIEELISDATIEKLIAQYDLNKPYDEEADYEYGYYEYMVLKSTVTDAKEDLEMVKLETWDEATTVPAPSEWAAKDIDFAYAVGIADSNKEYIYKNNITREEFCELIYSLMKAVNKKSYDINTSFKFEDTDNETVITLSRLGIINGKTETKFAPDDYLTREEAATIIVRMVNNVMPMPATEMWFEYDDINEVSEWASDSIQTISNLGFMNGVGNNKFAPKETYTTEQAIVTLVRVYEGAEAAGIVVENSSSVDSSIGIIGGTDGPTQIIVGDDTTVIGETDEPTEIIVTDTIEIDDFYIDEAIKLISESGKLANDKAFIGLYTANDEMTEKISAIGTVDFSKPTDVFYLSADREQIVDNITAMIEAEGGNIEDFGSARFEYLWRKLNFPALASMINASYGTENLAALTILTNSRGYIMPEDFKTDFALFLQYEGDYSAIVSFSEYGEGVISANMSFVKNGDKDNLFRRIYELTSALGEDSIKIARVNQ